MFSRFRVAVRKIQIRLSRRRTFLAVAFVMYLATLGVFSFIGDRGLAATYRLWSECRRLERNIGELEIKNRVLRGQIEKFRNDPRTLERFAREELHLAGENEIHYIFR